MKIEAGIIFIIIAVVCIAGIIVFSCLNIPGRELAMCIFGLVLVITAMIYMWIYNRKYKKK